MCHQDMARLLLSVIVVYLVGCTCAQTGNSSSVFLERCRRDCAIQRDVMVCGKYRAVRWLQNVKEKDFSYGPFKIIRIPTIKTSILPRLSWNRTGMGETLNFLRESAEDLLTKRAVVYTIDHTTGARGMSSGPLVVDEDELKSLQSGRTADLRLFKKKKALIFPVVILIEILKLKLMMIPVVLGVHFIKKILVVGSLVLPSILTKLRICKVPHYPTPPIWATAAETPVDYPTGYGHDDLGWSPHRSDYQGHYGHGHGASAYPGHHHIGAHHHNPYGGGYYQDQSLT